ncbi:hypothetical protein JTB14_016582 [Gonioctena quinquepunctata]|nr:hypothetical protein JTB14_016582 [Gonioctena quinquepunctata]
MPGVSTKAQRYRAEKKKGKFGPAPQPTENVWEKRKQQSMPTVQTTTNYQGRNETSEELQPRRRQQEIQATPGTLSIPPQVNSGEPGGSIGEGSGLEGITKRIKKVDSLADMPRMLGKLGRLIHELERSNNEFEQLKNSMEFAGVNCDAH